MMNPNLMRKENMILMKKTIWRMKNIKFPNLLLHTMKKKTSLLGDILVLLLAKGWKMTENYIRYWFDLF